jgi:hypothetical protein
MTLMNLAKIAGVTFVRCDPSWGGTWGYDQKDRPCTHIRGCKTKAKACESWAHGAFAENLFPAIE